MGIIRKQTISGSIFSYAGVLLGFINLAVLSPIIFSSEEIGLPALIIAISIIASQIGSLGFNNVTIRLFPYFRDTGNHHNGFFGLSLIVQSMGLLIILVGMIFFIPFLIEKNSEDISLLNEYAFLIIPVIIFQLYFVLFDSFCRVLYNAAIGIFLKEFVVRVFNLGAIILYWFELISFREFMYLYIFSYGVPTLGLLLYLIIKREFTLKINLEFLKGPIKREIGLVSLYGVIAGLSGLAVMNIDRYMINDIMNLSSVGIYSIAFSFGTLILIPGRAMAKIAATVIAEFWKQDDREKISEIYSKSSVNQFIGGLALLLVVWVNIDDIILLLGDNYIDGKYVILFISLANLITAISGVSIQILSTSVSYKYHSLFMILLIVLVVVTNILFIPVWGIKGAAFASLSSTLAYVSVRVIYIYRRFKMQPFEVNHLISLAAGFLIYLGTSLLPIDLEPLLNIFIRVAISGSVFLFAIYFLNCSPDFNEQVALILRRVLRKDQN